MEAAVQREPTNADMWCALGVRQQENEREQKAIQALRRALELQPDHQAARLALAVSYTNESNKAATVEMLHEWVVRHEKFSTTTTKPNNDDSLSRSERTTGLINCLLEMARNDASGEIDADVQIALAVLLNINEVRSTQ
jgi:peroxin-5